MHHRPTRRLSYANVAATLALALSVTGGAYAATQLPKNSVGSKQVKNSSLLAKDFKAGQLPAGPRGAQGLAGAKGETGAPGPNLLRAGRKDFPQQGLSDGCGGAYVSTSTFTVPQPAVLWLMGTGTYVATGAAATQSHTPILTAAVTTPADLTLAGARESSIKSNWVQLTSEGWVTDADGLFVLQPGTTYKLAINFGVNGQCEGGGYLDGPSISWAAYPVPS
jgi:hypothetical protein